MVGYLFFSRLSEVIEISPAVEDPGKIAKERFDPSGIAEPHDSSSRL